MLYEKTFKVAAIEETSWTERDKGEKEKEKKEAIAVSLTPVGGPGRGSYPNEDVNLLFPLGENPFRFGQVVTVLIKEGEA